jgi:cysteine synthase A
VKLERYFSTAPFTVYAKLESFNPCGSVKDRTARSLIDAALRTNQIGPGTTIIESSSGNLGIGLAQVCLYHGLPFICVVDPKTTPQNLGVLRAYGATIDVVEHPDPRTGEYLQARIDRVQELRASIPNSYWPDQYSNVNNARAHRATIREIVDALGRAPDYLFCATSSCGTLRGAAEYLRELGASTQVVAVDAVGSVIFGQKPKRRLIPGHGAAMVPKLFSQDLASRCVHVSDEDCVVGCRRLLRTEAILAGGSSGAVVSAIDRMNVHIPPRATCVAILADRGERYLDTIYSDLWVNDSLSAEVLARCEAQPESAPFALVNHA